MSKASKYLPAMLTLLVIAVNAAANLIPLNGYTTGALSDQLPTGFTPAGWVFSIWSLIYLGLIAFSLFGIFAPPQAARGILKPFAVSSLANICWIFAWHFRFVGASFAVMLVLLGSLVVIYRRLRAAPAGSLAETVCVDLPFRIYLGWIMTAAIANLAAVFAAAGSFPLGLETDQWAVVSVAAALALYAWAAAACRDPVLPLVFCWAAAGIYARPDGVSEPVRVLAAASAVAMAAAAIMAFISVRARR